MPNKTKARPRSKSAGGMPDSERIAAMAKKRRGSNGAAKPGPAAPTRAGLLADIAGVLDAVDAGMAKRPLSGFLSTAQFRNSYGTPIGKLADRYAGLVRQLDGILEAEDAQTPREDAPTWEDVVSSTFTAPPGQALTWSRPGSFLAWLGDIPVRCIWGGFALPNRCGFAALDARRLFLDSSGSVATGLYSIAPEHRSPEACMRARLEWASRTENFVKNTRVGPLVELDAAGRAAVAAFLAEPAGAWWREAVRSGPAEAVPMPPTARPVQKSLFG